MKLLLLCGLLLHSNISSFRTIASFKAVTRNYSNLSKHSPKLSSLLNTITMSSLVSTTLPTVGLISTNPLLADWNSIEYGLPPFNKVQHSDFEEGNTNISWKETIFYNIINESNNTHRFNNSYAKASRRITCHC